MWIIAVLQSIPLFYKIPIVLFTILCILSIFKLVVWIYEKYFYQESLEINYDKSKNNWQYVRFLPNYYVKQTLCYYYIYNVYIVNKTKTTVDCVSVLIDGIKSIIDDKNPIININPGETKIFGLYAVALEDEHSGKKVTVTATGKNIKPTIRNIIL